MEATLMATKVKKYKQTAESKVATEARRKEQVGVYLRHAMQYAEYALKTIRPESEMGKEIQTAIDSLDVVEQDWVSGSFDTEGNYL
jgi:hypothetical protein